jgi:hypothetical protein
MKLKFSKHARERMKQREISENRVRNVINHPDSIIEEGQHKIFQSVIASDSGKKYLYRVFINTNKNPNLIITVYRTTKIEKYS